MVLAVGGIGFEVRCSLHTAGFVRKDHEALLYTHLHVTDGVPSLLGFASPLERAICRKLLGVAGVGPAIALAALSMDTPQRVAATIGRSDVAALRRVKGIGPRTAERICLELRDAVATLDDDSVTGTSATDREFEDAVGALMTLGFAQKEARKRIETTRRKHPDLAADELTRQALRETGASA